MKISPRSTSTAGAWMSLPAVQSHHGCLQGCAEDGEETPQGEERRGSHGAIREGAHACQGTARSDTGKTSRARSGGLCPAPGHPSVTSLRHLTLLASRASTERPSSTSNASCRSRTRSTTTSAIPTPTAPSPISTPTWASSRRRQSTTTSTSQE